MKAGRRTALACALIVWTALCFAQSELKHDQRYAAGSTVESTKLGVTLTLPADWLGAYLQKGEQSILMLGSNTVEGIGMVIFLPNHTEEQVMSLLNTVQDLGDGVMLTPDGAVRIEGGRMRARYLNATYVGRVVALAGPLRNHVLFFYAGPKKNEAQYAALLDSLVGSTQFKQARAPAQTPSTDPWDRQWTQFLSGRMLKYFSSYDSGGGGGGIAAERTLHLCSDQSFAYFGASSMSIYLPGATAGGGGTTNLRGRWRVIEADQNNAVLHLTLDGGGEDTLPISHDGEKTYIGRERWFRVESDACR